MKKPIIGIVLDWEKTGTFAKRPYCALREDYFVAVRKAGGIPIGLQPKESDVEEQLELVAGLLVPGGGYPFLPEQYVDANFEDNYAEPSPRLIADVEFIKAALAKDMPMLGICAGMQEMALAYGAKFHKNIPSVYGEKINHKSGYEEFCHKVTVVSGSRLEKIVESSQFSVNSQHLEAVATLPNTVKVVATSADEVVEAIEIEGKKFALGVQWHPETLAADEKSAHFKIIKAFIDECRCR